ncbi:MAG TPA: hypothetical protein VF658_09135 [Pyrinomonadaceae bacterium]
MDAGEEKLTDENQSEQLRVKARRIHRRALITAVVITLVVFVFPRS